VSGYLVEDAPPSLGADVVTGTTENSPEVTSLSPSTVADVLRGLEAMGDLSKFAIDDLSPDEEDVFFGLLEDC